MGRVCGECVACCTVMRIEVLGKEAGVPCQHLTASGCGIYATRPEPCRQYQCLWLQNGPLLRDEDRPSSLGAMMNGVVGTGPLEGQPIIQAILLKPHEPQGRLRRRLEDLGEQIITVVLYSAHGARRRVLAPPALLERVRRLLGTPP